MMPVLYCVLYIYANPTYDVANTLIFISYIEERPASPVNTLACAVASLANQRNGDHDY